MPGKKQQRRAAHTSRENEMRMSSPRRLVLAALLAASAVASVDAAASSLRRVELPAERDSAAAKERNDAGDVIDEVELEAMMTEEYRRSLMEEEVDMGMDHGHEMFSPLECNDGVVWADECAPGTADSLSTLASAANGNKVVVPCGKCVVADTTDGSQLDIPGGLSVQGQLHFPADAKLTIRTTSVIVEGIFSTEPPAAGTTVPAADGTGVKIVLHGKDHVMFAPHAQNAMACGGNMTHTEECDVGKRAFVVAGGKLDVKAIDPACPSWVPLLNTSSTQSPPDMPTPGPKAEALPGCSRVVVDLSYKVGDSYLDGTRNDAGTIQVLPVDPAAAQAGVDDAYVSLSGRTSSHHGFNLMMDPNCVAPGANYLVTARVRLRAGPSGVPPKCSVGGGGDDAGRVRFSLGNRGHAYVGEMPGGHCEFIHEGEWFTLAATVTMPGSAVLDGGTGDIQLWWWNVEPGVEIDMMWAKVQLPEDASLPDDDVSGCLDLTYGNGNAEMNDFHPFPWASSSGSNFLHILEETDPMTGGPNRFYRLERPGLWWGMWYKKHGFMTPCVQEGVPYTFRLRWRYNSDTPRGLTLRFGWIKPEPEGGWGWSYFGTCPASSNALGWVDCEKTMTAPAGSGANLGYQIWNYIGGEAAAPYPSIDYDDISFTRSYEPPVMPQDVIHVGPDAASCWAPGSELLLTSATTHQDDAHRAVVKSSDPAAGLVTLEREVPHTTSAADDAEFPVEVALLDRNFELAAEVEGADVDAGEDDALHGGHMIVLHTPGVAQTLEGVEIDGFGQQGNLGRYPIHFHMSGTVEGSLVSRNVVKNSHQRGVVIHGTNNVTVSDNTLVDIKGHGYFLEDGAEQHNRFLRNLGALFYAVATLVPSGNVETDKQPSVFWMSNTANTWEGNVAAGGHIGFWIEMQNGAVRGPSAALHPFDSDHRHRLPLTKFRDNSAHSSSFCGMSAYPNKYTPSEEAVLENLRTYRNADCGILFHVDDGMRMRGGVAADNGRRQVWNQLASNIVLEGTRILGARPQFKEGMARAGRGASCAADSVMEGVTYSVNSIFGATKGLTLTNVEFDHFDCGSNSVAVQAEPRRLDNGGVYNSVGTIDGVAYGPNVPDAARVSTCAAEALGVRGVALEDARGDLDPASGPGAPGAPGFLVSDNDVMKGFAGGDCASLAGTCLAYCPDVCLQTFEIQTNAMSDAVEMEVSDGAGASVVVSGATPGEVTTSDTGTTQTGVVSGDATFTGSKTVYGVSLPAGTFTVTFRDALGEPAYPDFVVLAKQAEPACAKADTVFDVVKPPPTREACNELIGTGDFENNSTYGWKSFFTPLEIVSPGADGSGGALKTTSRTVHNAMITKYLDLSCLVPGDTFDVRVSYRIVDEDGNGVNCGDSCPLVCLTPYKPGQSWEQHIHTDYNSYDANGWNTISGQFTIPPDVSEWDSVHISFMEKGGTVTGNFIVDNWTVTKVVGTA